MLREERLVYRASVNSIRVLCPDTWELTWLGLKYEQGE